MDLRTAAHLLGGDVAGRSVLCPGPGHSPRDRSLSVLFSASAPDGIVCRSFSGDDWSAAKDHVRERLGLAGYTHRGASCVESPVSRQVGDLVDDAQRTARALAIWNEARTPVASPVEKYLVHRGLCLPGDPREVIRFAPAMPFTGNRVRGMVALVRDIVSNEPVAIHRTALDLAGHKIEVDGKDRLALGPIRGGAVKLTADENVTLALGIGEGIESTLSLTGLPEFGDGPVWALLNAGGVSAFPVLSGIEALWIAVDHDPAGLAAADLVADRWRRAGREVFRVQATAERTDLNDIVREARHG